MQESLQGRRTSEDYTALLQPSRNCTGTKTMTKKHYVIITSDHPKLSNVCS